MEDFEFCNDFDWDLRNRSDWSDAHFWKYFTFYSVCQNDFEDLVLIQLQLMSQAVKIWLMIVESEILNRVENFA
ncbi:unnamed protein product [Caenorhabditis angaria]|uniref:Uncharacterized protein n=1 Tax=Caenorhabditis angaria TaxID=860376 RepID=A0A9P1I7U4_9PELO|nr:unnamed protein product [Caenorhabditis angaria]